MLFILKNTFLFLCAICLISSCSLFAEQSNDAVTSDSIASADVLSIYRPTVSQIIKRVAYDSVVFQSGAVALLPIDSIMNLYRLHQYEPFYMNEARMKSALEVLQSSYYDGLNPEDYSATTLKTAYKKALNNGLDSAEAFELELSVCQSMIHYIHHMYHGKVDPAAIYPEWNYKKDPSEILSDSAIVFYLNSNPDSLAHRLRPNYYMYHDLRSLLFQIDSIEIAGFNSDSILYIGRVLKKGDTADVIIKIKTRLQSTAEYNFDSLTNVFDDQLFESIKIFQQHVGLNPSGNIDKKTIDKMNFTPAELRNAARVNMERFRWLMNKLPDEFILVNIADYTMRHFKDRKVVYEESVIVGRDYNRTPVFQAMMTYIEFNPYWTVPVSIATKEILPSLKKNPYYLQSHNMELFQGNTQVAIPSSFNHYTTSYFPFTIREKPGPKNSLGQVKLAFPNPYSIYMHDTPGKYLFDRDERSFSHGCIRLKNPVKFAVHLLSVQGVTQQQADKIIASGKNYPIVLKTKIPVLILYFTCYTKAGDKRPYFFKDIYGRDKTILTLLDQQ